MEKPGHSRLLNARGFLLAFAGVYMVAVYLGMEFYFEHGLIAVLWPAGGFFLGVLTISQIRA
jgi:hypothetical protein